MSTTENTADQNLDISSRVHVPELLSKVTTAQRATWLIEEGMNVGASGFTMAGYPKEVMLELARKARRDPGYKINLCSSASLGPEADTELARGDAINVRVPYQSNKYMREAINHGQVKYIDMHLSRVAQDIRRGILPNRRAIDVAVVEACQILKLAGGRVGIVPTMSVGNTANYVAQAEKVIVEINFTQPAELYGMHDCACVKDPPYAPPLPLTYPDERSGDAYIACPIEKIVAIVPCNLPDRTPAMKESSPEVQKMAANLIQFLKDERASGRLPEGLFPIQSGVGSVGNSILKEIGKSDLKDLYVCSEVIQDGILDLIDSGKVNLATATALTLTPEYQKRFYSNVEHYKKSIILRAQEVTNSPALIRRLGIIGINTAIECDIYGNINSSHICGTQIMNGIGGSCDFARNSPLTIFLTTATAKDGKISSVVPFCSHVDSTEHDVDVIISDYGVADLRGLSPKERAVSIINNVAHPDYRPYLMDYFTRACELCHDSHTPHILTEAFAMHQKFLETGSMKMD